MRTIVNLLHNAWQEKHICPICQAAGIWYGQTPSSREVQSKVLFVCTKCTHKWVIGQQNDLSGLATKVELRATLTIDYNWLLRYLPESLSLSKSIRVLDIGCWDGSLLNKLPVSWIRHGIEINPKAVSLARARGLEVFCGAVESVRLPHNFYDLILIMDVLEHIERPIAVLQKAADFIKQGGYLVVLTGNGNSIAARFFRGHWYYFNYEEHTTFFSPHSANIAMNKINVNIVRMYHLPHHTSKLNLNLKKAVSYLLRKRKMDRISYLPSPISKIDKCSLLISRLLHGNDHLMIIGHRTNR